MKVRKILGLTLVLMLAMVAPVLAANYPETVNTTATVNIAKVLTPSAGNVFPNVDTFNFKLEPVSYTLAENGVTVADTDATYMPAGADVAVQVALNAAGDQKEGNKSTTLEFAGKGIGVYTYKLTEVNTGIKDVEYDPNVYYVNVYVVNQVDENNVPTGATTVKDITAWKTNNMSDEALKGLQTDWTGSLITEEDTEGKMSHSTLEGDNNVISYPFKNDYETQADLSLTKIAKGNFANKRQYFTYKVTITDGLADGTYAVEYTSNGEPVVALNGNPATITSGEEVTITLKHDEKLVVKDLPSSATYTITENQEPTYSAKYTVTDGSVNPATGEAAQGVNLTVTGRLADNGMVDNVLANEDIVYVNTKEFVAPTGIIVNVLPFACGVVIIAAIAVVSSKKREELD